MNVLRAAILLLCAGGALPALGAAPDARTISVHLKNADVRQVVAYILRGTDVNYAFADDVSGRVTCGLHDVPVERALQAILSAAGCELVEEEGALLIRRRVPPPQPASAAKAPEAALAPPTDGMKAGRPEGTPTRDAAPIAARSAGEVTYVVVPLQPQPAVEPMGAYAQQAAYSQASYVPAHPHHSVAYQWLQGYGGLPMGGGYGGFTRSAGAYRADAAWLQRVAASAMMGSLPGF